MEVPKDCKGCGKCCRSLLSKNVPVFKYSTGDSKIKYLDIIYGRCEYLDENNECTINNKKPQQCKDLIRGSYLCLDFLRIYEEDNLKNKNQ